MAINALTSNFNFFFSRLNPSPTYVQQAASEHNNIRALIEDPNGKANVLSPKCFLQGSYKQATAIDTINDVDIVTLCKLWQPGSGSSGSKNWSRDEIFDTIAAPLLADRRYRDKIRYHGGSMCIKVDLGIKVEILPVVYKQNNYNENVEPFRLYRPETHSWEDGYARYHQLYLSLKNISDRTQGNFKPTIKLFKHLRSYYSLDAVSFHIESLLYSLPDNLFWGYPAEYITTILNYISGLSAEQWYQLEIKTPCGERSIFIEREWNWKSWIEFYKLIQLGAKCSSLASATKDVNESIKIWQMLFGAEYFPMHVTH